MNCIFVGHSLYSKIVTSRDSLSKVRREVLPLARVYLRCFSVFDPSPKLRMGHSWLPGNTVTVRSDLAFKARMAKTTLWIDYRQQEVKRYVVQVSNRYMLRPLKRASKTGFRWGLGV